MANEKGICIPGEDKPCPWCQQDELDDPDLIAECFQVENGERWSIRCQRCECIGPEADTCEKAWEKWNTRPLPWPED